MKHHLTLVMVHNFIDIFFWGRINNICELILIILGSSASAHDDHPDFKQENNTPTGDIHGDESRYEETCVLVDGNDYHHAIPIPINNKEQTRCSYKVYSYLNFFTFSKICKVTINKYLLHCRKRFRVRLV